MKTLSTLAPLTLVAILAGCGEDTSRWEAAQEASEGGTAVSEAALDGAAFNKFFPSQGNGIDVVFKQEKEGFAQATLLRDGKLIGTMSIFDTRSNPTTRDKFQDALQNIGGYPAAVQGSSTSVLVADRFQVQLRSEEDALPASDRAAWLEKFDLAGLANAF